MLDHFFTFFLDLVRSLLVGVLCVAAKLDLIPSLHATVHTKSVALMVCSSSKGAVHVNNSKVHISYVSREDNIVQLLVLGEDKQNVNEFSR